MNTAEEEWTARVAARNEIKTAKARYEQLWLDFSGLGAEFEAAAQMPPCHAE